MPDSEDFDFEAADEFEEDKPAAAEEATATAIASEVTNLSRAAPADAAAADPSPAAAAATVYRHDPTFKSRYLANAEANAARKEQRQELMAAARQARFEKFKAKYSKAEPAPPPPTTVDQAVTVHPPVPVETLIALLDEAVTVAPSPDPSRVFERLCWLSDGVVVDSEHPYGENLNQSLEIAVEGAKSVSVVFDPRSCTATGDARIELYRDGALEHMLADPLCPLGLGGGIRPHPPDVQLPPGMYGAPPLFIPAPSFAVRFACGLFQHHERMRSENWGWRLAAFACDNEEHAAAMVERAHEAALVAGVLDNVGPTGKTPLHAAAWAGNVEAVRWLLSRDVAVDLTTMGARGCTALHVAARAGHRDVVKLLLDANADILRSNDEGELPLHLACRRGSFPVARLLLDADARLKSLSRKNQRQARPRDLIGPNAPAALDALLAELERAKKQRRSMRVNRLHSPSRTRR